MEKNEANQSKSVIEELEVLRLADKKRYTTIAAICIPIVIAGLITGFMLSGTDGAWIAFAICGSLIAVVIIAVGKKKGPRFETEFKRLVVTEELQNVFQDVEYKWNSAVGEQLVRSLNIFHNFDIMHGEDYVSAGYKGRKFFRSDFSLYVIEERKNNTKDSDENAETETVKEEVQVFSGSFTCIERDKPYPARLLFFTEKFPHIRGITGQSKLEAFFGMESNELVTESIDFNRDYEVACDNQIGGRVILSPRRMQLLRHLDEMIPDHFAILFEGNKLYVIVRSDDSFNASVFGKATAAEQQKEMANQVSHLRERIDLLLELEE